MTSDPFINPFRGIGRNDPCPCGSGKKFKKCCLDQTTMEPGDLDELSDVAHSYSEGDLSSEGEAAYDPLVEPDPTLWPALDEQEQIDLVEDYHRRARLKAPRATAHAIMHVIVENQIAEDEALPAKRAAERLISQGLDRHEAIHAIGSVLIGHMNDLLKQGKPRDGSDPNAAYFAELERLTAEAWRRSG